MTNTNDFVFDAKCFRLKISSVVESKDESSKDGSSISKAPLIKGTANLEHGTGAPSQQLSTKVWFYVKFSELIEISKVTWLSYIAFSLMVCYMRHKLNWR